jgi:hypothetical protein
MLGTLNLRLPELNHRKKSPAEGLERIAQRCTLQTIKQAGENKEIGG